MSVMFLFFESTKCAFNLIKRHHNTNGSFCSTPPPPTWIRLFRRKKSAPFSFLNSYCHFWGLIAFPCAVKGAHRVFCITFKSCVCVYAHVHAYTDQPSGLWLLECLLDLTQSRIQWWSMAVTIPVFPPQSLTPSSLGDVTRLKAGKYRGLAGRPPACHTAMAMAFPGRWDARARAWG